MKFIELIKIFFKNMPASLKKILISFFLLLVVIWQLYFPISMIQSQENILAKGKTFRFITAPVDPLDFYRGKYVTLHFAIEDKKFPLSMVDISRQEIIDLHFKDKNYNYNYKYYEELNAYLLLKEDKDGFAQLEKISFNKPITNNSLAKNQQEHWLKAQVLFYLHKGIKEEDKKEKERSYAKLHNEEKEEYFKLILPFDRFYLNEKLAPKIERWYRETSQTNQSEQENSDSKTNPKKTFVSVKVYQQKVAVENLFLMEKPLEKFIEENFN